MKSFTFLSGLLLCSLLSVAQTPNTITPGAMLLFQNVKTKLTSAEKNNIFQKTGFLLSKDKKQFVSDKESMDFPFSAFVYPTDMNKDGKEEVFIVFGNSYTSGNTGSSIVLYIPKSTGDYQMNLGFPGMLPEALTTGTSGYPDLLIPGPGFEFPVWRWNGNEYVFANRTIKDKDYEKTKKTNIETVSKNYTSTLK